MKHSTPCKNQQQTESIDEALCYVWREIRDCYDFYRGYDKKLVFNDNKEDFFKKFHNIYNEIKTKYMREDVVELDRHKVVAAQITACIEANLITREVKKDQVFLGLYMIALEVGLNWMLIGLNEALAKAGVTKRITTYTMPDAFACPTKYFEVFSRNLFYSHVKGKGLNPLDISEKLFLLEYITLLSNDINPQTLKYNENT